MKTSILRRWAVLATVSTALLLITLDNSVLYTALPTLIQELNATSTQALWIINAYPLVMAGLLLGAGTLGDRIGHRQMFLGGLCLFGVASLYAAFAPSANLLITARALLAVGAAAMMPATLALICLTFDHGRERNLAIAIWGSISIVGFALGPILGGLLLQYFWWGSVFLINVPIVVIAIISGLVLTPHNTTDASRPWDLISSLQILVTLSGLVYTIKEIAHAHTSWTIVGIATLTTAIAGTLFTKRQSRLQYPLLDFSIFRNNAFRAGSLAAALATFAIGGVQLITTQRFQLVAGFSPLEAGLLVSAVALGSLPSAILGGAYVHKTGLRPLISGGLFISMLGILLTVFGLQNGFGWMIAGLLLTGFGLGGAVAVASSAIVNNAPVHRAGMASSVEEVSYEFGSLLAVALLGSLLSALYTLGMKNVAGLPDAAKDSITKTLEFVAHDPTSNTAITQSAAFAFDQSYLLVMQVIAIVLMAGAIATWVLLRRYGPGTAISHYTPH